MLSSAAARLSFWRAGEKEFEGRHCGGKVGRSADVSRRIGRQGPFRLLLASYARRTSAL